MDIDIGICIYPDNDIMTYDSKFNMFHSWFFTLINNYPQKFCCILFWFSIEKVSLFKAFITLISYNISYYTNSQHAEHNMENGNHPTNVFILKAAKLAIFISNDNVAYFEFFIVKLCLISYDWLQKWSEVNLQNGGRTSVSRC